MATVNKLDQVNLWRRRFAAVAEITDYFRLVPRTVLVVYGTMVWEVLTWFMALKNPGTEHTALVVTVVGAAVGIIGFYQNSGKNWDKPIVKWFTEEEKSEMRTDHDKPETKTAPTPG